MRKATLIDYLPYARILIAKPRRGGGNGFRHQVETLAILIEYGYSSPVLLKAALIHDLIEDGTREGHQDFNEIRSMDSDGENVMALVMEVSRQINGATKEPKGDFLLRIMMKGSEQAKVLKLADRISNLHDLPLAGDPEFIKNYIAETEEYIIPYARSINPAMARELEKLILSTYKFIQNGHIS